MGTSSSYGGPGGSTPLVPTWLDSDSGGPALPTVSPDNPANNTTADSPPSGPLLVPPNRPIPQSAPVADRFRVARVDFSRFASSGGSNRASLGRAIAGYVSKTSGGARQAARRMGSSRVVGAKLLGFLSDAQTRGARQALRALNLESLAGQPIEDIFLGLADYVCPEGGTVDEGIAREAFIETIADLAEFGITDLDALTAKQMQTVFELYASHAIEARLCNDIGMKVVFLPTDVGAVERVQTQLRDFIQRGVADALTSAQAAFQTLTMDRAVSFVDQVYKAAFTILETLGQREAEVT